MCASDRWTLVDEDEPDARCHLHQEHRPMTIPRCNELTLFLKYVQGVVDVGFRHSGIAPFTLAWSTGVRDEEQRHDKLADAEVLKREQDDLQRESDDETLGGYTYPCIDDDVDVRDGFITGVGYNVWYQCVAWYSVYVYSRLWMDDDEEDGKHNDEDVKDAANIRDWAWRVVAF